MATIQELSFRSLTTESQDMGLEVKGAIPSWLKGNFVRNGPALFEIGKESFNHWFDGQAMLHSYKFDNGKVIYSNKFLDTENLRAHRKTGKIAMPEFGTNPKQGFFGRLAALFKDHPYENANVNVAKMGGRYVAMTEVPTFVQFDPQSLDTRGSLKLGDQLSGHICTAHPQESATGESINVLTRFGKDSFYILFKVLPASPPPSDPSTPAPTAVIATIPVDKASYMHSFGLTSDYAILTEYPYKFSLSKMLMCQAKGVLTGRKQEALFMFDWEEGASAWFRVVRLADGGVVGRFRAPGFFAYHIANCFQEGTRRVCLDIMCYERAFYEDMSLECLRRPSQSESYPGQIRRYTIDLEAGEAARAKESGGAVSIEVLVDSIVEFPRINERYRFNGGYRFLYGVASDGYSGLTKADIASRECTHYKPNECMFSEPVFVGRPGATEEDDGVVLAVVLDGQAQKSYLVVLDASSFQELARAYLPHHVPAGLHGCFWQDA